MKTNSGKARLTGKNKNNSNASVKHWQRQRKTGIVAFCFCAVTVVPLLVQQAIGMCRRPDRAWWYHVPVCLITLWTYGWATLANALGFARGPQDRTRWQRN